MSLIEMMVALAISLIVIGAVGGVYLSSSRNYSQDELISRMQENARFALHVLAEDLSMAGYWGPLITNEGINAVTRDCTESSAGVECVGFYAGSVLAVLPDAEGNECGPGTIGLGTDWTTSILAPVEIAFDVGAANVADIFGCLDPSEFTGGTDILVVKRVDGYALASDRDDANDNGEIFLRTDGMNAMLMAYASGLDSEGPDTFDWPYRPRIYYIRNHFLDDGDGIPTLTRKTLSGNVMETQDGGVAQGIERFRILFGVDTNGNATANYYTADPAVTDLTNIVSARIYVLARSVAPDSGYDNTKTYQLGADDVNRTFNDSFYRRVFSTTVSLRNQRNRIGGIPGG